MLFISEHRALQKAFLDKILRMSNSSKKKKKALSYLSVKIHIDVGIQRGQQQFSPTFKITLADVDICA